MKIEQSNVRMLTITDAPRLDPVDVFIVNYAPGKGRITIRCWDRAWTCAWFSMGGQTIEKFFAEADADYVYNNMSREGMRKDALKREREYVMRIIQAVQAALRELAVAEAA